MWQPFGIVSEKAGMIGLSHQPKTEVKFMDTIALLISIIGSINWGLVGIFKFDLVAWLFGGQAAVFSRIIYY